MTDRLKGSVFIILAAASYGLYGVYSRLIGGTFGEFAQSWTRNLIVVVLLGIYLLVKPSWKKIERKDRKWMILWPLVGVAAIVLIFSAFNHLQIGTSYFLLYATMIGSGYVSGNIFFREKLNMLKLLSIILSLVGLVLIFSVEFSSSRLLYIIFALFAGVSTGLWNVLSKKISDKYSNIQLVFIDALVATGASLIGSFILNDSLPSITNTIWIWQILFALTQISAVAFLVLGFRYLEAQIASIILPVEAIFGTLFGFLFFQEILSIKTLSGGMLIAAAAVLPNLQSIKKRKKKSR